MPLVCSRRRLAFGALALSSLCAPISSFAQIFPAKPVRVIVPFTAGSAIDVNARVIGQKLGELWGQQVIIDNRVGANSIIGVEAIMKSAPDGYTIGLVNDAAMAVNPALYPKLPYNPLRDFAPITLIGANSLLLVVHPNVAARTVPELIALARDKKGELNFASGGNGSAQHLPMEMLMAMTGTRMTHVPYKGVGPGMNDVIAGLVPTMFVGTPGALPHIKAGKLRALAIASGSRSAIAPDTPTVAESGVPGFAYAAWVGYVAPAGTPAPLIAKLNADIVQAMSAPEVRDKLGAVGFDVQTTTPEGFGQHIAAEMQRLGKVVREAGIKAQ